jgi:hypothetical protein
MDAIDKLLAQLQSEHEQQQTPNVVKPFTPPPQKSAAFVDSLLAEVQADFAAKDAAEELQKQAEREKERIHQAQIKAQQIETLKKHAKDWLEKLDPFSPEGFWFERFSESYPSKLDAAMEYLQNN